MGDTFHFPTFSYVAPNFRVEINFNALAARHKKAQQWLGDRVLEDCRALMPIRTGSLQQRSHVEDNGRKVIFPGPYGRFQYMGKVMVDPETGSPWARGGVKKIVTDRPLIYSNPTAEEKWFEAAKTRHLQYWLDGVKKRIGGR